MFHTTTGPMPSLSHIPCISSFDLGTKNSLHLRYGAFLSSLLTKNDLEGSGEGLTGTSW